MDATDRGLRKTHSGSVLLWTGAILPFLLSLVFHAAGPAAQVSARGPDRPALAFDQYLVDLGPRAVEPRRYVFARFMFTNRSEHTAVVKDFKPSCGCLKPWLEKRSYAPGESGEFYLRVQTANQEPGPKEYFIKFMYEDPQPREVVLTFRVMLPEQKVVVRPKALIFYQLGTASTTREIFVTDYRSPPLEITDVKCSSALVSVALGKVDEDSEGTRRSRVVVTVNGRVPPGRHQALITISTDDPVYDKLQVPLLIQGPDS